MQIWQTILEDVIMLSYISYIFWAICVKLYIKIKIHVYSFGFETH